MRIGKPVKLSKIYYKIFENDYALVGMQLVFTNGFKTPMFQNYYGYNEGRQSTGQREIRDKAVLSTNVLDVDPNRTITKVCMRVQRHQGKQKFMGI